MLGELLGDYRLPLYLFARKSGLSAEAADDAVQGLWLQLLERDSLAKLDRARGLLRSFLRTSLRNYIAQDYVRAHAQKRGGDGATAVDSAVAEALVATAPPSPDAAFERAWAVGLMQRALERLAEEYDRGDRRGSYSLVQEVFGFGEGRPYPQIAQAHGMSVSQLKSFAFRARGRFKAILAEVVGDTVDDPAAVEHETHALLEMLR